MTELARALESSTRSREERLIALCIFGLLAMNYPLLQLFDKAATWLGIPSIIIYLFGIWGIFIIITALILESGSNPSGKKRQDK